MKILIIGSKKNNTTDYFYYNLLKEKGYNIKIFESHDIFNEFYYRNIFNKILFRLKLSNIYYKINVALKKIALNDYDIIWIFKGMEIYPSTISYLKNKTTAKIVNYNGDHPYIYESRGFGNKNVLNSIKLYDLHLSYSKEIQKNLINKFNVQCKWLPFGYEWSKVNQVYHDKKIGCFIGNPDNNRAQIIRQLTNNGIMMHLYGNNWIKHIKENKFIKIFPAVHNEEYLSTAQKYRFQLNIFRNQNKDSHNMRTFEMPAFGCISLNPYSKEQTSFFEENIECFYYNDNNDLISKAKHIINLSEEEAYKIKQNAYNKSISSNYKYSDRINILESYFNEII
ncbi:glycosyltransferase family protein [Flammeovirga agarivorans]|uniref:Glycosyltransferase n=1 Tax=Flammeovirga agarivorans TaxID=2726742 RepID=A0A7X8SI15_9BACT|nr:glycosyltransferase [Flammeovirga agarivorans]NLR90502.1 glycosyltransferase [Flammeovirga agarivorans]